MQDPFAALRAAYPRPFSGGYFAGHSLGLPPQRAENAVRDALHDWRKHAVTAWTHSNPPWFTLVEESSRLLAPLLGARGNEVTLTANLTLNLHHLLHSFFRPDPHRNGILIDDKAFPSDRIAADAFTRLPGNNARLVTIPFSTTPHDDWESLVERYLDDTIQIALLPSVVYTNGRLLDLPRLTRACHLHGTIAGWDLAHSSGIVPHQLHNDEVDFAYGCTYKYLNGGPGSPGFLFLHEKHASIAPAFAGWFSLDPPSRFAPDATHTPLAESTQRFQTGTPPILNLAALHAALLDFSTLPPDLIRSASLALTAQLIQQTDSRLNDGFSLASPRKPGQRGGHVALRHPQAALFSQQLRTSGFVVDHRPPDILRIAPHPFYNSPSEIDQLVGMLAKISSRIDSQQPPETDLVP